MESSPICDRWRTIGRVRSLTDSLLLLFVFFNFCLSVSGLMHNNNNNNNNKTKARPLSTRALDECWWALFVCLSLCLCCCFFFLSCRLSIGFSIGRRVCVVIVRTA